MKNRNWHGIDKDTAISLFEYGVIFRWVSKGKFWQSIYKNPYMPGTYSFGSVDEEELNDMFINGWARDKKEEFLDYLGATWDEYLAYSPIQKANDIGHYFGFHELFGDTVAQPDTAKQICKRLKIKYDDCYEEN